MFVYNPEEEEAFFDQINEVYMLTEADQFDEAEKLLLKINATVHEPRENSTVGAIMLDSLFTFYEQAGKLEKALPYFLKETDYLKELIDSHTEIDNPAHFITTGHIYYASSQLDEARDYFKIAYHLGGDELFEENNPDFIFLATTEDEAFKDFKSHFVPNANSFQEELTEAQQDLVDEYCEQGNAALDAARYDDAIASFKQALAVLPAPVADWDTAGWISASLGDVYFSKGDYTAALEQLLVAEEIYSRDEANPFVYLRLGEAYFETGDQSNAIKFLLRAYKMEGAALFEEDRKYLNFLKKEKKI
jgi:tetratricopeptide (TPR) repeat protein